VSPDTRSHHTVEGIARVVSVDDGVAWLEPEQTTSCGGCASASACGSGAKGIGSVASRLEARRFRLEDDRRFSVGARIVVGVDERALLKGALTAYAIPLATAFAAGAFAQWLAGTDLVTMASMAAGMAGGLLVARIFARRLARRGELSPRFLRFAAPGETCHTQ
jgi:sigma-E factor negative regulatory protein RseC